MQGSLNDVNIVACSYPAMALILDLISPTYIHKNTSNVK